MTSRVNRCFAPVDSMRFNSIRLPESTFDLMVECAILSAEKLRTFICDVVVRQVELGDSSLVTC